MTPEAFKHADVITDHHHRGQLRVVEEKGSIPTPLDFQLLRDAKRVGWYLNSHTLKSKLKRCLNCGAPIKSPRRQKFCCDACRYAYNQRKYRERKRLAKINKPVMGLCGELHVIFEYNRKLTHTIIPAIYAQNRNSAMEYVDKHYTGDIKETIKSKLVEYYEKKEVI